jgi:poly(3-hydroxybutyrate) depolymerase
MKMSYRSLVLAIVATLVALAIATYLFLPFAELRPVADLRRLLFAPPPLRAYGIDIHQTSVSGVSSGGAMAVQMHVAHSSIMRGVGVIAGVAYDCTDSDLPWAGRFLRGVEVCLAGSAGADAAFSINRTTLAAGITGAIDPPANLAGQKVWLFSGYNDGLVRREAMNAVAGYYDQYVNHDHVFYKTNHHAPHALVTDDYGGACLGFNDQYINNCGYDAAGRLLEHIYGRMNPRSGSASGSVLEFDQSEFAGGMNPKSIGLADKGYVYVPTACLPQNQPQTCRVHVVFHGCLQYAGNPKVKRAVVEHGGYNKWADTNRLIVLYPQTVATNGGPLDPDVPVNPNGCWDWWGISPLPRNNEYARKTGYQISAIKAMLDRLAEQFVAGSSPDTFGTPQSLEMADSTSTSVELVWQPNSAAAGFNIYRSPAIAGPYAKINSQPVSGASFVDRGLTPSTTYHYKVSALDPSNLESPPTSPIPGATASQPPACDPYFSDNVTHFGKLRAWVALGNTFALGSNDQMGPYTDHNFSQLTKESLPFPSYRVRYCP